MSVLRSHLLPRSSLYLAPDLGIFFPLGENFLLKWHFFPFRLKHQNEASFFFPLKVKTSEDTKTARHLLLSLRSLATLDFPVAEIQRRKMAFIQDESIPLGIVH